MRFAGVWDHITCGSLMEMIGERDLRVMFASWIFLSAFFGDATNWGSLFVFGTEFCNLQRHPNPVSLWTLNAVLNASSPFVIWLVVHVPALRVSTTTETLKARTETFCGFAFVIITNSHSVYLSQFWHSSLWPTYKVTNTAPTDSVSWCAISSTMFICNHQFIIEIVRLSMNCIHSVHHSIYWGSAFHKK